MYEGYTADDRSRDSWQWQQVTRLYVMPSHFAVVLSWFCDQLILQSLNLLGLAAEQIDKHASGHMFLIEN